MSETIAERYIARKAQVPQQGPAAKLIPYLPENHHHSLRNSGEYGYPQPSESDVSSFIRDFSPLSKGARAKLYVDGIYSLAQLQDKIATGEFSPRVTRNLGQKLWGEIMSFLGKGSNPLANRGELTQQLQSFVIVASKRGWVATAEFLQNAIKSLR